MMVALLAASVLPAAAQTPAEQAACAADQKKFCANVKPGEGRIAECLADHAEKVSAPCRKVLEAHDNDK
jgi:hypothetical protein